jgi:hypothetical protein
MISFMKFSACLEPIFARGLASIHLVNLSIAISKWVKPQGPRRSRPHTANDHVMGIV